MGCSFKLLEVWPQERRASRTWSSLAVLPFSSISARLCTIIASLELPRQHWLLRKLIWQQHHVSSVQMANQLWQRCTEVSHRQTSPRMWGTSKTYCRAPRRFRPAQRTLPSTLERCSATTSSLSATCSRLPVRKGRHLSLIGLHTR